MENLAGKRLLILGANPETAPLVQAANEMGVKTLVTSHVRGEAAKAFAWKAFDVDGMDVPGLVALARDERADGVLVGVADILVPSYCKVCSALGFPCYATQEIVDVFSYKDVFKATCERYGVHGVPEYYLDERMEPSDVEKIHYPVMVKPVDGYSGLGMTVCSCASELGDAVEKALQVSKVKRFLVEQYINCDDMGMYYTFQDGYCSASCVYDRYATGEQPGVSRVCLGGTYPSRHLEEYFSRMHGNVTRMFREIGIKNGVLMLSAFYKNGEFYVYDTGFRLQGEAPHLLLKAIHGYDQREMLIRFALTGQEGEPKLEEVDDARFGGKYGATLWFLLKEGRIGRIEGLDDDALCRDTRIVAEVRRLREGDTVRREWIGTEKQVLTRLYMVCDSKRELAGCLKEYQANVRAYDTDGNPMLLRGFDVDCVLGG